MIKALMDVALKNRAIVIGAAALLVVAGLYAFHELDIEAYPDPIQPRIEIITQPLGRSAEEVERLVTRPLESGLAGLRNLETIRTISIFGLSDIKLYFSWDSDYYWDRVETINRLGLVTLPPGITAGISPDSPIGQIYRYRVESPDHDLMKEKEVQDWVLEKQLKTVPGVEDVSGFGGLTKEYHVDVDAERLSHYKISLPTLQTAIANANNNVGGSYLSVGDQALNVRGIGSVRSLDDIKNITLTAINATPTRVGDVADVSVGHAPRLGIVGMDEADDLVEGIVLMRKYGNTLETIKGVKKKIAEINASGMMPPGFKAVPLYDRAGLVGTTLTTVFENLAMGMLLVFLVLLFFLGNLRAAFIAAINIPLAMFGAFILLYLTGTPANLLSLGAVDFGIIIDSTVIVVENIFRHLTGDRLEHETDLHLIRRASEEVGGPMFYSTLIFLIAFLPLFTMKGVEGVIFSPLSHMYAFALTTAILLAVTLAPVLGSFLLPGARETKNVVWESVQRLYHNLFVKILERPRVTLAVIVAVMAAGLAVFPFLGGEFLPKLEEGNIWARATLPLTSSLGHGNDVARRARRILKSFPEATMVYSQLGRPDDGTDTTGFFNIEFSVDLKPKSQWRRGTTKEKLLAQMDAQLKKEFPEANLGYSQYIEDNVEEALSGVKGTNAIKVYGPDLGVDEGIAGHIKEVIRSVRGMTDIAVYRSMGQPDLLITPDRKACSRYGLNVGDVNAVVQAAIGGQAVTRVYEGERQSDLVVRWQPQYRQSLDAIRQIRVALPNNQGYVPLAQVADIKTGEGASFIYREGLRRYVPIRFGVRDRDMQSTIEEAKRQVAQKVKLPEGVTVDWVGEYGELQAANRRLMVIIPIALLVIMAVLYAATSSFINTLIIMAQIPLACLGGILALVVTRTPFSVSAAVGFISIFAISIMNGILLNFYIHQLWKRGHSVIDSIVKGADRLLRALMMAATVAGLGLLPMALSTRVGAQTQRPLAIVVIGGSISIALLTQLFLPTLIYLFHRQIGLTDERRPRKPPENGMMA